jgi:transposase
VLGPTALVSTQATGLKNSRYALWKKPEYLMEKQVKLAWVAQTDPTLSRAYYLKKDLRRIFNLSIDEATEALDKWVSWPRLSRIPAFVKLHGSIVNTALRSSPPSNTASQTAASNP